MSGNDHNLTIGHCNIQGGLISINKSTEINQLIRSHSVDVFSINETNLNDTIHTDTLNLPPMYDFVRKDRGVGTRGGCGLLINRNCAYSEINMHTHKDNIEAVWIKIKTYNIYVCGFYRSSNYCNIEDFLDYMMDCMYKLKGKKVVWIGDINLDQNNINNASYKKLDLTLKAFNMVQTIQGITRIAKYGDKFTCTTIDVIMTNCYSDFIDCTVLENRIGDHQAIKCMLDFQVKKAPKFKKIVIRDHSIKNIEKYVEFLNLGSDYSQIMDCNNVDLAAVGLNDHLSNYYEHFFPIKTIRIHEKYVYKPSKQLLEEIRLKSKLYRKFKSMLKKVDTYIPYCNKCNVCRRCIKRSAAWDAYKEQRNLVTKLAKNDKRANIVEDLKKKSLKNDLKGIWRTIKNAANMSPSSNKGGAQNCTNIDPNVFNEHFSTVGSRIQAQIPSHENIEFSDFLPTRPKDITSMCSFREVTSSMVEEYIKSLSNSKAVFDKMPIKIFKSALTAIIDPLTHIVNLSLSTGIVPAFCKFAQVTPIHKGGNIDEANNYRPISILPIIAKCIEYFVNKQLTEYMEENNLFTDRQYGFRKNHSTTYLMLDLFDEIYDNRSKSNKPGIVFLDIKKAFDSVNHDILLKKLEYYGINGTALQWFRSFLTGRHQRTKVNGKTSTFMEVTCGVPQGSILGPLLFSIFINDIEYACNLSKPYLFADDGALFFQHICRESYLNVRIEMLTITKWLEVNKLALNIDKTQYIIFDNLDYNDRIYLDTESRMYIDESKVVKYLGLMVDHKLSFKDHIEYIKKKIIKRIGAMYRSSSLLPIKYRKMFANALMLPNFDYLDIIYSKACKTKLNELDILYKKVAKIALGVPTSERSLKVYSEMKWLPLHLRRQLHMSAYMFRIINNVSPSNCINKFSYITGGSRDGNNCNLYTQRSKTLKDFYYLGAKCWNNLPQILRNQSDVKTFSKCYKSNMLESIRNDPNYEVNNAFNFFYKLLN